MNLKGRYTELEIDSVVVPDGNNPRQIFDNSLLAGLGESLAQNSQLQPIIINRVDGENRLIAGERRLRAAREAGLNFIEAKVYEDLDEQTAFKMTCIENSQRVDLNVLEKAAVTRRLIDHGLSIQEVADIEHISLPTVYAREKISQLPEEIQQLMIRRDRPLSQKCAVELAGLDEELAIELANKAANQQVGRYELKAWIDAASGPKLPGVDAEQQSEEEAESELEEDAQQDKREVEKPVIDDADKEEPAQSQKPELDNDNDDLGPVAGNMGAVGKFAVSGDGAVVIDNATITIRLNDQVKSITGYVILSLDEDDDIDMMREWMSDIHKNKTKRIAKKEGK